ncbi:MAG: hypothetical protein E7254_06340 [Lachnospiraceae bacterium]|nr:hypothetical protein [Lachnospiraceae bacterium]
MVVSLLLVLGVSTGVSASSGYDRQEADAFVIMLRKSLSYKYNTQSVMYYCYGSNEQEIAVLAPIGNTLVKLNNQSSD